jgi:phospholipid/cholesterol/gamma-HCH transport system substrate-binding protein
MRYSDIPKGSREKTGMTPFRAGVVAAVVITLVAYFGFSKANPFADPYELSAVFENSNRLAKRSPVRIAGVDVGKVVDVQPLENGSGLVKVKMQIRDEGLPIKRDAELTIRSRLFLEGNYFVDLEPGTPSAPELDEGSTIPPNQTASPVQFAQVLTTLQSETRQDLRTLLYEYSQALKREGAAGFNLAVKHWEDAYRNTSQVNDATLGRRPHDLTRVLNGQGRVFGALSRDEEKLEDLVTGLNDTISGFARQEDNLRAAIPELRDVFREGRPSLASLNRALPEIRGFARDALPGARSSSPTLDAQIPFVRQLRRLFSEPELRGLSRQLAGAVPSLARLNSRSPATFAQNRALAACQHGVLVPFAKTPIPDPSFDYHSGEPWFEETGRAFVGLAGESRLADANSSFFRTQGGAGPTTVVSTGEAGERLFGQALLPINGVRPARPTSQPPYRPNVPCENQEPPDLNAPGGPAPEQTDAEPSSPLPRASAARERARPEQYRRLDEFVSRTRRGLPALDPLVWWGQGERMQLRRLGLMRNKQGRIVERGAGR